MDEQLTGVETNEALPADGAQEEDSPTLNLEGEDAKVDSPATDGEEKSEEIKYEAFEVPEDVERNQQMETSFGELAKGLNLSQEQAQKAVDWYMENFKLAQASVQTQQDEYVQQLKQEALSDSEIGRGKWKGDAEVSVKLALDRLGTPKLRQVINENPALGNHPEIIRFFKRAGDLLREGQSVGAQAKPAVLSAAEVLFGENSKK